MTNRNTSVRWRAARPHASTTGHRGKSYARVLVGDTDFTHEQYEVVMQAVTAALLWGEDMGLACTTRIQGDYISGNPTSKSMTVSPGALQDVTLDSAAASLLYRATNEKSWRGVGIASKNGITSFDLRSEGE